MEDTKRGVLFFYSLRCGNLKTIVIHNVISITFPYRHNMGNEWLSRGFRAKGYPLNNQVIIGKRIIIVVASGRADILWEYFMDFTTGDDRVAGTHLFGRLFRNRCNLGGTWWKKGFMRSHSVSNDIAIVSTSVGSSAITNLVIQ